MRRLLLPWAGLALAAHVAAAQQGDVRAQLAARGLPADLASSVAVVAAGAAAKGLPADAIVSKAVEGWFKHVPPGRIVSAVRDLSHRLEVARADLRAAGVADASGPVIGAVAEATAQGIARADEAAIIRAAPDSGAAASGLSVSAALVVQGMSPAIAARLVIESFRGGRNSAQVLDLPAAARALQTQGVTASDVGRQLLQGINASARGRGAVTAPLIPPGSGLPIHP